MKDGVLRRAVKRVALAAWQVDLAVNRAWRRRRGQEPYVLGGECHLCAACCEAPAIQVGRAIWYLPLLRRIFLAWQRHLNGFVLRERRAQGRVFVFECTHFDRGTRRCDSYDSRPGMCRDYPRALLFQPSPEMLPGCGYRPVLRRSADMRRALEAQRLSPEQMEKLRRGLHLDG